MVSGKLPTRYTRALFELAVEDGATDRVGRDLEHLAHAFSTSDELRFAMQSPSVIPADKVKVLDNLLKKFLAHRLTRNFCMVLLHKGRIHILQDVAKVYEQLQDKAAGRVRAKVVSAATLSPIDVSRMKDALTKALGAKEVHVDVTVDPSLIGGMVTRVGNVVLDSSLRHRLETMREHLLHRQ